MSFFVRVFRKIRDCRREVLTIIFVVAGFLGTIVLLDRVPFINDISGSIDFSVGLVSAVISIITWFSVSKLIQKKDTIVTDVPADMNAGIALVVDVDERGIVPQVMDLLENKSAINKQYQEVVSGYYKVSDEFKFEKFKDRDDICQCDIGNIIGKSSNAYLRGVKLYKKGTDEDMKGKFLGIAYSRMPADSSKEMIPFIDDFNDTLNKVETFIVGQGITSIFLFCSAPMVIQGLIQARFDNRFKCHVFHYSNGSYLYAYTYGNKPVIDSNMILDDKK